LIDVDDTEAGRRLGVLLRPLPFYAFFALPDTTGVLTSLSLGLADTNLKLLSFCWVGETEVTLAGILKGVWLQCLRRP